ncbi:Piso0_002665 [Millerozyma farinosa CBS 7064]|uniref:Piso0_002665 protein n=1 Tax=Pichia sorbitophila (strain ATCC MYA-4447 / BCRC 22081 / CBS 7064 / NBRC 10061 / NRRL Y-12695) TaxID=559304 RepID=G8YFM8_PICSO|nr:Piso0_002665 [Millerozyma farinosa CBS 7064]
MCTNRRRRAQGLCTERPWTHARSERRSVSEGFPQTNSDLCGKVWAWATPTAEELLSGFIASAEGEGRGAKAADHRRSRDARSVEQCRNKKSSPRRYDTKKHVYVDLYRLVYSWALCVLETGCMSGSLAACTA